MTTSAQVETAGRPTEDRLDSTGSRFTRVLGVMVVLMLVMERVADLSRRLR